MIASAGYGTQRQLAAISRQCSKMPARFLRWFQRAAARMDRAVALFGHAPRPYESVELYDPHPVQRIARLWTWPSSACIKMTPHLPQIKSIA
jgi:hypothetical protein